MQKELKINDLQVTYIGILSAIKAKIYSYVNIIIRFKIPDHINVLKLINVFTYKLFTYLS